MSTAVPLSTTIALARAGALDHAWAQFCGAGYDRDDGDPAALTVKGRLLNDDGLRASDDAAAIGWIAWATHHGETQHERHQ